MLEDHKLMEQRIVFLTCHGELGDRKYTFNRAIVSHVDVMAWIALGIMHLTGALGAV